MVLKMQRLCWLKMVRIKRKASIVTFLHICNRTETNLAHALSCRHCRCSFSGNASCIVCIKKSRRDETVDGQCNTKWVLASKLSEKSCMLSFSQLRALEIRSCWCHRGHDTSTGSKQRAFWRKFNIYCTLKTKSNKTMGLIILHTNSSFTRQPPATVSTMRFYKKL